MVEERKRWGKRRKELKRLKGEYVQPNKSKE